MYDFISTQNVPKFYFLNPKPEDIHIFDIAHALSLVCRFGGHCSVFYSVAEHSIIVADILEQEGASKLTVLAGLLHDAEEAYLPDIPHPIKQVIPAFKKLYAPIQDAIVRRFGLVSKDIRHDGYDYDHIDDIDHRLVITEAKALGVWNENWEAEGAPLKYQLHLWKSDDAEDLFLRNFLELGEAVYEYKLRS